METGSDRQLVHTNDLLCTAHIAIATAAVTAAAAAAAAAIVSELVSLLNRLAAA